MVEQRWLVEVLGVVATTEQILQGLAVAPQMVVQILKHDKCHTCYNPS